MTWTNENSEALYARNAAWIAGGVVSLNRKTEPQICFRRGEGCRVWDEDVRAMMGSKAVHMGSGTPWFEGRPAELLVEQIPALDRVQIANAGSEAMALAIRLALMREGIYHIPLPTKQGSISAPHGVKEIDETLEVTARVVKQL